MGSLKFLNDQFKNTIMNVIVKYLQSMDNWERAAFYPYLFAPILLTMLLFALFLFDNTNLAIFILLPIVVIGYFTFVQISRAKFGTDSSHYFLSGGMIMYGVFFPALMQNTNISVSQFTLLYYLTIVPTLLGHVYSLIYQFTSNLDNENRVLVIKK